MIRYDYWSNIPWGRFSLPFYPMITAIDRKKQNTEKFMVQKQI
jgi:hypothetical protein